MSQSPIALNVIIRSLGSRPRQTAREQVTVNPTEWALIASSLRRVRHAGSACGLRLGGAALLAVLFTTACGDWLDHPVAAQTNGTVPAEIQTEAVTEAPESNSSDRANQVDPAAQPDLDEQPVLEQPDPDQPAAGEVSDLEAARLIAQLASPKFAERENAVVEIVEIGMPMVPHLRRAIAKADDPELKQRATTALVHLTSGHFEAKVADFLRFKNDGSSFEGWLTTSAVLGDTGAVREMFIQILRSHPQVVAALDGTTRDRNLALEQASQTIQINMFQHHIFPSLSDGVALLLPLCDPDVVFSVGYESTLISVLQKHIAQLRQDAGLNGPVTKLLDEWIARSRVELRNESLWWAMQWDIDSGATLGIRTLSESTDVETLQTAFQAIARYGKKSDAKLLEKYFRDPRPAVSNLPAMVDGQPLQSLLGDVALAATAVLHQKAMKELGMPAVELHPKVAFLIDNVGYPAARNDDRIKAQSLAESWINGETMRADRGS